MALAPALGAGVEECWMDVDGARMRYLRTRSPLLAKDARNGTAGGSGGAGRKAGPSTPRERPSDDHAPLGMTNQSR